MRKILTPEEREQEILQVISTFAMEGITLTRETAEKALDKSLSRPLPEL